MQFIKTEDKKVIDDYRKQLYTRFTSALDSMWESLYIAGSHDYLIESNGKNIGYCCIDADESLTQIFLIEDRNHLTKKAIEELIELKLITSAKLSSIEPLSFNICLAKSSSLEVNTLCFQYPKSLMGTEFTSELKLATEDNADSVRAFYKKHVGFEDTFGYTDNLINRKELYLIRDSDEIVGTGECRLSDSQPESADVGVAVNKAFRGIGIATVILKHLATIAIQKNRHPICSTTLDNIGSQKAIERAGFYCSHFIFDIDF